MKNSILRKWSAVTLAAVTAIGASQTVLADVIKIDETEFIEHSRLYRQDFTFIDLKSAANRGFADEAAGDGKGGWSDQGPANDMSIFNNYGKQTFGGIDFNIIDPKSNGGNSCIMLRGRADPSYPTDAEVTVDNLKTKGLYFLHACPYSPEGQPVGSYTIVYSDGTEEVIELIRDYQIFEWWNNADMCSDYAVSVWNGQNGSSVVNLNMMPWSNPYPDKEITKIKAHTLGGPTDAYLGLVAVTATNTDPYLPQKKKVVQGNLYDETWYPYYVPVDPWAMEGTPLDASNLLEKPSGQHGHATAVGDDFVFEDGTTLKVWGVNVGDERATPEYEDARATAKMIASLGFNCVRIQATNNFIYERDSSKTISRLSTDNMDKFCYLINEFKKNGIYYGIDMPYNDRQYMQDDVKYFDTAVNGAIKYYDPDVIEMLDSTAKQLLTWENPYTGMTLADDPSLVWVSLYNESTIYRHASLGGNEYYNDEIQKYFNEWLKEKYPTRDALNYAWYMPESTDTKGLEADEDQFEGTVRIYGASERKFCNVKRYNDMVAFLGDMERKTYRSRMDKIKEYAPKVLTMGTTGCYAGGSDVYVAYYYDCLKEGDVTSQHSYWYLPGGNGEAVEAGTTHNLVPASVMANKDKTLYAMGTLVGRAMDGKPYMQTEWDSSQVNPYRSEAMLMMGAFTCTQNWNPYMFNWYKMNYDNRYNLNLEDFRMIRGHDLNHRPDTMQVMPNVARMVLRGDVKEADKGIYQARWFGRDVYDSGKQGITNDALPAMVGKSRITFDDVYFDPDFYSNDVLKLYKYGEKTGRYIMCTDEAVVDYNKEIYYLNTERTQAACGYLGGEHVEFDDVIYDIDTAHTTVYMTSLSNDSLADTDSMLFTYSSDSKNDGMELTDDAKTIVVGGTGPIVIQPVLGKITLKSKDTFKVYALDFTGHRKAEVDTGKDENGFTYFRTRAEDKTMNYEIVRTAKSSEQFEKKKISYLPEGIFDDLFTDLGKYEPYKKEIERMSMLDYVVPVFDGLFYPEQGYTRGEAVSALVKAFSNVSSNQDPGFADVTSDSEYYNDICTAAYHGMISSDSENFRPNDYITREEFAAMVYRGIQTTNMMHPDERGKAVTDLSKVSDYAKEAVSELVKHGYCDEVNSLDMKAPLTRADAAIVLYRILWE